MKITVITVCYNAKNTILDTINSVASQNYTNKEHIVIDGASTDGTTEIILPHQDKLQKFITEPDKGIYHAMNKGIAQATGDVIGFLNADDTFANDEVLQDVATLMADDNIDCCYGDLKYYDYQMEHVKRYWKSGSYKEGAFGKGWNPPHPTFYCRRAIYQQYGGFDLSLPSANDIELMMRFLEKYRVSSHHCPKVWVNMRVGGVSNSSFYNIIRQNKMILRAAHQSGIHISPWRFALGKFCDRMQQITSRAHP